MKKKLLAMTLASALCAGMLAGCGSSASTGSTGDSGSTASGDAYNVTVIVKHTDGHFNKVIAGARAYGNEHDNVNVEIQSPTSATSYDEQVNMIETALGKDKPTAVIIAGVQGDETHEARLRGYRDAIEAAGGQVLEVQYTDTMPDKAAAAMEAVIQKYPNGVDAVLSIADDMALAAAKVIKDSGNTNYADTVLCGFDGNQSAIEAVMDGSLTIDIAQMGYDMGYKAVEAAVTVLEGGSVESFIDSGSKVIDSSNIDEYVSDMKSKGLWE